MKKPFLTFVLTTFCAAAAHAGPVSRSRFINAPCTPAQEQDGCRTEGAYNGLPYCDCPGARAAYAAEQTETICGYVEQSRYCRPQSCSPPTYELSAPFENFLGLYHLDSSSPAVAAKFERFFESKTKVCATGTVSVLPESFPEEFRLIEITSDIGQVFHKERTLVSFDVTYDIQGNLEASLRSGQGAHVYIRLFDAQTGGQLECGSDLNVNALVVTDLNGDKLADVPPICRSDLGGILEATLSPQPSDAIAIPAKLPIYMTSPDSSFEFMPKAISISR